MKHKFTTFIASAPLALVLITAGCGGDDIDPSSSSGPYGAGAGYSGPSYDSASAANVGTAETPLGRILVDNQGRTLYAFEGDENGRSACEGACSQEWPPLLSRGGPLARSGVTQSLLGTTRRADRRQQVTYAGHPLYRFVADGKPGDTNGEGVQDFGATWEVLSAAGGEIEADGS